MSYKYICKFQVTGHGEFPFDMLRYDRCFPSTEAQDSYKLRTPDCYSKYAEDRTVTLLRYTEGKANRRNGLVNDTPTEKRWESFGWTVSNITWEKLP